MNARTSSLARFTTLSLVALIAACTAEEASSPDQNGGCDGGKCDTPSDSTEVACEKRQKEAINSSQRSFTPETIRWACADVEGVTASSHLRDDRGQEYCEYFAVIDVPNEDGKRGLDFGRLESRSSTRVTPLALCTEEEVEDGDISESACRAVLDEDQFDDFADRGGEVVGSCVFTSWHRDVFDPVPDCADGDCIDDKGAVDVQLDEDFMSMKGRFNANGAASKLVADCVRLQERFGSQDPDSLPDALKDPDPFIRGCSATALGGAGIEWRRSDPAICAAVMRTVECGCSAPGIDNATDFGFAVVPRPHDADGDLQLRGFPLGTWDDKEGLPPGCRYAETGEDTKTVVLCDLTGADVLAARKDPKEACRSIYANNVVVHIDLPVQALSCEPDAEDAESCGINPWNLGDENAGDPPGGSSGGDDDDDSGESGDEPPPAGDNCIHLAEVFYDADGGDNGKEWIKLYNSCDEDVSLEGMSLGWGGSSYAAGGQDLEGKIGAGECFIVGGTTSDDSNGNPEFGQSVDIKPDLQNSGAEADGVALFDGLESDVTASTRPLDAVIYGEENLTELLDTQGERGSPSVGDAPAGGSIIRTGPDAWMTSDTPDAAGCPEF